MSLFADDIILACSSFLELQLMLGQVVGTLFGAGLELNPTTFKMSANHRVEHGRRMCVAKNTFWRRMILLSLWAQVSL